MKTTILALVLSLLLGACTAMEYKPPAEPVATAAEVWEMFKQGKCYRYRFNNKVSPYCYEDKRRAMHRMLQTKSYLGGWSEYKGADTDRGVSPYDVKLIGGGN